MFEFDINILKSIDEYSEFDYKNAGIINTVSTLNKPLDNSILFMKGASLEIQESIQTLNNCLIISDVELNNASKKNTVFNVLNPRLTFAKILRYILDSKTHDISYKTLENGSIIAKNVIIGANTIIEPFVFIDDGSVIGANCYIKTGCKIRRNVKLGNNAIIGENTVIGSQGYGLEQDKDGRNYRIPHIGGVTIGNFVEIGANSVIASGTIYPTVISDYAMIDDYVMIAHNCYLGISSKVISNSQMSGSSKLGNNSILNPGVCIVNGTNIGDNVNIGIGSVVTKDIADNAVCMGNPARVFKYVCNLCGETLDSEKICLNCSIKI